VRLLVEFVELPANRHQEVQTLQTLTHHRTFLLLNAYHAQHIRTLRTFLPRTLLLQPGIQFLQIDCVELSRWRRHCRGLLDGRQRQELGADHFFLVEGDLMLDELVLELTPGGRFIAVVVDEGQVEDLLTQATGHRVVRLFYVQQSFVIKEQL